MLDEQKIRDIAIMNGLGFKIITVYRAELIHLKNDGFTAKKISKILNEPITKVQHWYKGSQPTDKIMEKLEDMYLKRIA